MTATSRVWSINPDDWGVDDVLIGSDVFQPILFAGQYKDGKTIAWRDDGTTRHRPNLRTVGSEFGFEVPQRTLRVLLTPCEAARERLVDCLTKKNPDR